MRFTSGRLVEVLTKKKVPSGTWRCAAIVADNGDGYTVRYYRCPGSFKEVLDEVSTESVRPCPPLASTDSMSWAVGDVVEVLDGGYWKVSVIEEDLGEDWYQIRVIGSLDEFRVKKSNIRMRQEWINNSWVSLGKGSENCEDLILRLRKKAHMQTFAKCPSKSPKRLISEISSAEESYSECKQKWKAVNKKAKLDRICDDSYSFIGKAGSHCKEKLLKFSKVGSRNQSFHDDSLLLARISRINDCDLLRHESLIAGIHNDDCYTWLFWTK